MNTRISQKISISLSPDLCAAARAAAASRKVALSWLVARALENYLGETPRTPLPEGARSGRRTALVGVGDEPAAAQLPADTHTQACLARIEASLARIEAQSAASGGGNPKTRRARYRGPDDIGFMARSAARETERQTP